MSDIYSRIASQALRCVASSVDCELLCAPAQKSDPAAVSDTYKKVQIQGECLGTGEDPAAAPVLIAELDFVRRVADYLKQFLTLKQHFG